ncbi:hypothetical protein BSKO_11050 [Bryopsis sp. KO-2023]|nr:hypothetical protein BSKO_11050 [Bryopsis sp. KO-2023]
MDEEGFPQELMMDLLMNRAMPQDVVHHIQDQGIPANMLFPAMFPEHVGQEILQNVAQAQLQQIQPPPAPDFSMDYFTMSYRDPNVEKAFLRWESDSMIGIRNQNFLLGFVILMVGFLAYYPVFQCDSNKGSFMHWPCEGRLMWIFWSILMWALPFWNAIPVPYLWQYRDVICAVHQVLFGIFITYTSAQITHPTGSYVKLDPLLFCTLPVLVESTFARVRLKYYVMMSFVLMAVVVYPWVYIFESNVKLSIQEWVMNCVIMFVAPGCILMLYETVVRKQFENGFAQP